ncbi:hypothetical protein K788_00002075 [Paraburkholderia caribensis MBA4]|uniref:Uncharacterized protein n=2 Tax=Paraburkholderia caribensis TaxID=75105 RepID=A0A0P0RII2_9BURK|nr:hypothetical protein K788_00002075 [Paraburkholderia caribensis MBA4]
MEAGEDLVTIMLRKEWERRLGGGRFLWGIAQVPRGIGGVAASRSKSALALFSPRLTKPRTAGRRQSNVLLWNAWIDATGQVRPLPSYAFVTSSAKLASGKRRENYYALVCSSPNELRFGYNLGLQAENLRHVSSGKRLGAATSTAIVAHQSAPSSDKRYPVALAVSLEAPFYVKLAQPIALKARDLAAVVNATRIGDFEAYVDLVRRLRNSPSIERGCTQDLFDIPTMEICKPLADLSKQAARFVASVVGRQQRPPQLALF